MLQLCYIVGHASLGVAVVEINGSKITVLGSFQASRCLIMYEHFRVVNKLDSLSIMRKLKLH